ncbi:hypothetical protein CBM2629_A260093 [Cupriavidus taiwanensis]|nr:hypothetical protein CBM2629_A260093 [Cupriavidus taiwanensis]
MIIIIMIMVNEPTFPMRVFPAADANRLIRGKVALKHPPEAAGIGAVRAHNGERNPSIRPMGLERRLVLAYT